MDQAYIDRYKQTLRKYIPSEAVDCVFDFMDRNCVRLHITRQRATKLGDYRWPQTNHRTHEISVNGDLNPYKFLTVLLHEMAHLNCYLLHQTSVQPHGHEWQEEYRQLLLQYLPCFPHDIAAILRRYTARIPLSRTIENELDQQLRHYDRDYRPEDDLTLDDLQPGDTFRLIAKPKHLFTAQERRRTRWLCLNLIDHRQYLVAGTAQVMIIAEKEEDNKPKTDQ